MSNCYGVYFGRLERKFEINIMNNGRDRRYFLHGPTETVLQNEQTIPFCLLAGLNNRPHHIAHNNTSGALYH